MRYLTIDEENKEFFESLREEIAEAISDDVREEKKPVHRQALLTELPVADGLPSPELHAYRFLSPNFMRV